MKQIDRISRKYNVNLSDFDNAKEDYYKKCFVQELDPLNFDPKQFEAEVNKINNSDIAKESFNNFRDHFYDLLRICALESKVKEDADLFANDFIEKIAKAQFCGDDTNIEITIGLFRKFYLITKLGYTNNLKYMPDSFWEQLLKLSIYGKFEFKEGTKPPAEMRKKHPDLFKKRGSMYKFMRNYFLNEIEFHFTNSLGYLTVEWDNDTKLEDMLINIIETFRIMYNLNYMLWTEESKQEKIRL